MVDKQFVKVAKMKREETLKTRSEPKQKERKYSFVTTWDPAFPDIRKGSFRVAFKKGHKNLKEIIAVKHFYETPDHSVQDFKIMEIVQLKNPPKKPKALTARLIEFESYWQIKLQTLEPYGLNSINEFQEQMKKIGTLPMNDPQGSICPRVPSPSGSPLTT